MSRPALPGGKADVEISFGRTLLGEVDAAARAQGLTRSAFVRLACRRLIDGLADGEVDPDDLDDDDVEAEERPAGSYQGPTLHAPQCLSADRWVARYPLEWTDDQVVAGLRAVHPDGVVLVHRQAQQVLAWTESPAWVRRAIDFADWTPAPWVTAYGLDELREAAP